MIGRTTFPPKKVAASHMPAAASGAVACVVEGAKGGGGLWPFWVTGWNGSAFGLWDAFPL